MDYFILITRYFTYLDKSLLSNQLKNLAQLHLNFFDNICRNTQIILLKDLQNNNTLKAINTKEKFNTKRSSIDVSSQNDNKSQIINYNKRQIVIYLNI